MMRIIAAIGLDRCIGLKNDPCLPWNKNSNDLKRFSELTKKHIVIMGRRTWDSLNHKPLKDRYNIIVSRKLEIIGSNFISTENFNLAISYAKSMIQRKSHNMKGVYIIGGEKIFQQGQNFADEIDLTVIPFKGYENHSIDNLIYFPYINFDIFHKRFITKHPYDDRLRIIKYVK